MGAKVQLTNGSIDTKSQMGPYGQRLMNEGHPGCRDGAFSFPHTGGQFAFVLGAHLPP